MTMSSTFQGSKDKRTPVAEKKPALTPNKRFPTQSYYNGTSAGIAKKYGIPLKGSSPVRERSYHNHEVVQRKSTTPLKSKSGHSALRKKPSLDGIKEARPVTKKPSKVDPSKDIQNGQIDHNAVARKKMQNQNSSYTMVEVPREESARGNYDNYLEIYNQKVIQTQIPSKGLGDRKLTFNEERVNHIRESLNDIKSKFQQALHPVKV